MEKAAIQRVRSLILIIEDFILAGLDTEDAYEYTAKCAKVQVDYFRLYVAAIRGPRVR